jgi:hypothetical protein
MARRVARKVRTPRAGAPPDRRADGDTLLAEHRLRNLKHVA